MSVTQLIIFLVGFAVLVSFHWLAYCYGQRARRGVEKAMGGFFRWSMRVLFNPYSRRKAMQEMQARRRKQGLPALENPELIV